MTTIVGMRVVRGPDWEGEDSDGGEAHVGTVMEVLGEHSVRVLWDTGVESTCRAGRDGKLDLRIFDTAPVGVRHPGRTCSVCDEVDVAGILWRCVDCTDCTLCPACYSQDRHQLHHRFSRVDTPGSCGMPVKSRKISVKIRSIGMFPGAKVMRGKDWIWGEQDGGMGSKGEVEGFEIAPESCRNILRVRWPNGSINSYRLGYKGHVDLFCVEEEVGPSYYRDHLPLLDVRDSSLLVKAPSSPTSTTVFAGCSAALSIINKDTKLADEIISQRTADLNDDREVNASPVTSLLSYTVADWHLECEENTKVNCASSDFAASETYEMLEKDQSAFVQTVKEVIGDGNVYEENHDDEASSKRDKRCVRMQTPFTGSASRSLLDTDTLSHSHWTTEVIHETVISAQLPVSACEVFNGHAVVSSEEVNEEEEMYVKVDDSVAVAVEEDELVDLQKNFGGCTQKMKQAIGVTGRVVRVSKGGSVYVNFVLIGQYRFNPKALVKEIQVKEGQLVRIRPDKDQVKILNRRVGWKDEMTKTLGQIGRVIKLDEEGVAAISFGNSEVCYTYTKACCLPAHGAPKDSHNCRRSGSDTKLFPVSVVLLCGSKYLAKDEENKAIFRVLKEEGNSMKEESASVAGSRDHIHSLFVAIETGDRVTVSRLCTSNRELLESEWNRMSPLMAACTYGHLKIVKLLLNLGANVSRMIGPNTSPLGAALEADHKQENICIFLIERGADVRLVDSLDRSYMHVAATYNLPNVIGVLAARGANVNAKDKRLDTPLHNAVQRNNHRAMEALLEVKGIDVRAKNKLDYSALHLASKIGCTRTIQKILALDASGVNDFHNRERTPLHLAALNGHVDCIRLLVIDGKANIDLRNDGRSSQTALHYACAKAKFKVAEALMELEADVNLQDRDGNSPLHLTVGYWSKTTVDVQSESTRRECQARVAIGCMLISKGAYVDAKSRKGLYPFMLGLKEVREGIKEFMKHKYTSDALDPDRYRLVSPSAAYNKTEDMREGFLRRVPCGICFALQSEVTLLPCQHKWVCNKCSNQMTRCPICHAAVSNKRFTGPDD